MPRTRDQVSATMLALSARQSAVSVPGSPVHCVATHVATEGATEGATADAAVEAEREEEDEDELPAESQESPSPARKRSKKDQLHPVWTTLLADPRNGMLQRDPNPILTTPEELLQDPNKRKFELVAAISLEGPLTKPNVDEKHVQDGCLTNAINSRCGGALPVEVSFTEKKSGESDRVSKTGEFRLNNADEQAAVEKLASWAKGCIALKTKHIAECVDLNLNTLDRRKPYPLTAEQD